MYARARSDKAIKVVPFCQGRRNTHPRTKQNCPGDVKTRIDWSLFFTPIFANYTYFRFCQRKTNKDRFVRMVMGALVPYPTPSPLPAKLLGPNNRFTSVVVLQYE